MLRTLTWFTRFLYVWHLQVLNTMYCDLLKRQSSSGISNLRRFYLIISCPLTCLLPQIFFWGGGGAFQSFDYKRFWRRLFQKRVVFTNLDIYISTTIIELIPLLMDYSFRWYYPPNSQLIGIGMVSRMFLFDIYSSLIKRNVFLLKLRFSSLGHKWHWPTLDILFRPFLFTCYRRP